MSERGRQRPGRRSRRGLRPAIAVALLAGTGGVLTMGGPAARAGADTQLSSYTLTATASGVDFEFDQPDAPAHPEGTATVPETTTLLTNGGIGYGLSTIFWPGPLGGNFGSLLPLLIPSQEQGITIPHPDAVSQVINQYGPLFNDPVKAEAHSGSSPDAAFNAIPGVTLIAHADDNRVDAEGTIESLSDPAVLSIGNLSSHATTTLKDDTGTAVATARYLDIEIAGLVHIAKVESRAESHTNGSSASPSGTLTVAGVTVGGVPAVIDASGVHVDPLGLSSPLSLDPIDSQLKAHGIRMFLTPVQSAKDGGDASYSSSSLFVSWDTGRGQTFTLTLGGSRVAVTATPPFVVASGVDDEGDLGPIDAFDTTPASVLGDLTGVALGPTPAPVATGRTAPGARPIGTIRLAHTFTGVAAGWVLAALALVALLATGAIRLAGGVLDHASRACPQSRR